MFHKFNSKFFLIAILFSIFSYINSEEGVLDYSEKDWPQLCKTGMRQTPIDIPNNFTFDTSDYFSLLSTNYTMINSNGVAVVHDHKYYVQNITNSGPLMVKKAGITYQYDLIDIHFHIVSEHTMKGVAGDVEMHFVHTKNQDYLKSAGITNDPDAANGYLVVGTIYRATAPQNNESFGKFDFANLKPITNLNPNLYVNTKKSFYHYIGGLTTPGCTEAVNWVLMEDVELISASQLNSVKSLINKLYPNGNARAVKPLNGRVIYYKKAETSKPSVTPNDSSFVSIKNLVFFLSLISFILI